MTLKPPTRTLPKVVIKEWPGRIEVYRTGDPTRTIIPTFLSEKSLSDFTRVVEETGILDQERSQNDGSPSNESEATKSDKWPAGSADIAGVPMAKD